MLTLQTILHPTDFSPSSDYAFRLANTLARDHGSKLIVLHVAATLGPELLTYGLHVSPTRKRGFSAVSLACASG